MSETLSVRDIVGCSRCGGEHPGPLEAKAFAIPFAPPEAGLVWTHWVACPTNGDPILIAQVSSSSCNAIVVEA